MWRGEFKAKISTAKIPFKMPSKFDQAYCILYPPTSILANSFRSKSLRRAVDFLETFESATGRFGSDLNFPTGGPPFHNGHYQASPGSVHSLMANGSLFIIKISTCGPTIAEAACNASRCKLSQRLLKVAPTNVHLRNHICVEKCDYECRIILI